MPKRLDSIVKGGTPKEGTPPTRKMSRRSLTAPATAKAAASEPSRRKSLAVTTPSFGPTTPREPKPKRMRLSLGGAEALLSSSFSKNVSKSAPSTPANLISASLASFLKLNRRSSVIPSQARPVPRLRELISSTLGSEASTPQQGPSCDSPEEPPQLTMSSASSSPPFKSTSPVAEQTLLSKVEKPIRKDLNSCMLIPATTQSPSGVPSWTVLSYEQMMKTSQMRPWAPLVTSASVEDSRHSWEHGKITAGELKKLNAKGINLSVLLVDCRPEAKSRCINVFPLVNVPFIKGPSADPTSLPTKSAVVKFCSENCPGLLWVLNCPGYYSHVVVLDNQSTAEKCSRLVVQMLTVLQKWNESSRTATLLLEGGFATIMKSHVEMVGAMEEDDLLLSWKFLPVIIKAANPPSSAPAEFASKPGQSAVSAPTALQISCHSHMIHLDVATKTTKEILKVQRATKSLITIKSFVLREDHAAPAGLPDADIPDAMKCLVCKSVFAQEIFQCEEGHCFCPSCSQELLSCPRCKAAFPEHRTRNKAVEAIMSTLLVSCPYSAKGCPEKRSYQQVATHTSNCDFGKTKEIRFLDRTVASLQLQMVGLTKRLKVVTNELHKAESTLNLDLEKWKGTSDASQAHVWAEQIFTKKAALLNLNMALVLDAIDAREQ